MDSINNACKFGSDAWLELQAFKTRQLNRREKLNRHKNIHKDLIDELSSNHQPSSANGVATTSSSSSASLNNSITTSNHNNNNNNSPIPNLLNNPNISCKATQESNSSSVDAKTSKDSNLDLGEEEGQSARNNSASRRSLNNNNNSISNKFCTTNIDSSPAPQSSKDTLRTGTSLLSIEHKSNQSHSVNLELVECLLLLKLCDVALKLPIDSRSLQRSISKIRGLETTSQPLVENLLQKFAHQELISIDEPAVALLNRGKKTSIHHHGTSNAHEDDLDDETCIYVTSADHTKLVEFDKSFGSLDNIRALLIEPSRGDDIGGDECDLPNSVPIQSIRTLLSSNDREDSTLDNLSIDAKHHQLNNNAIELDHKSNSSTSINFKNNSNSFTNAKKQSPGDDLESLLSLSSTKERESKKLGEELLELLSKPTAKERNLLERFRSADGYQVQEFCPKGTKGECNRNNKGAGACDKLHFKKIIAKHTEESLGDCSFLNTCFHMDSCKYVHYEVDYDQKQHQFKRPHPAESLKKPRNNDTHNEQAQQIKLDGVAKNEISNKAHSKQSALSVLSLQVASNSTTMYTLSPEEQARIDAKNRKRFKTVLYPPQWIQCDLRFFDMSLLGKFSVVMADPPWDIHMELPYGTMSDDEMRKLNIPALQDEGVIFLWVTGRAMELGRECLGLWGYERCDEIIWVKTNQLQRIIRTGRTGHWLNHGKEHCLVGVKGNPKDINRGLDCDVIVAEVRATSHKPDEIYGIIERLSPGTRKIELFGRAHNVQPNWITLGNQLNGVRLIEPSLVSAFKKLNLPFQTVDNVA